MNTNGNYNACLDWVTLVGEDGDGETKPMREAVAAMEKLVEQHGQWHSFSLQGYEGQTCGPISAGFKSDNFIIKISGKAAYEDQNAKSTFRDLKLDDAMTAHKN